MRSLKKDLLFFFIPFTLFLVSLVLYFFLTIDRVMNPEAVKPKEDWMYYLENAIAVLWITSTVFSIIRYIFLLKHGGKVRIIAILVPVTLVIALVFVFLMFSKFSRLAFISLIVEGFVFVVLIIIVLIVLKSNNLGNIVPTNNKTNYVSFEFRYFSDKLENIVSENFPGTSYLSFDVLYTSNGLKVSTNNFPGCGYLSFDVITSDGKIVSIKTDNYPGIGYVNFDISQSFNGVNSISCDNFFGNKIYFYFTNSLGKPQTMKCDNFPS